MIQFSPTESTSDETQFYINQLKQSPDAWFTPKLKQAFIAQAKAKVQAHENLYKLAQDYEKKSYLAFLKQCLGSRFTNEIEQEFKRQAEKFEDLTEFKRSFETNLYRNILKTDLGEHFPLSMEQQFLEDAQKSSSVFSLTQSIEINFYIQHIKQELGAEFTIHIDRQLRDLAPRAKKLSQGLFDIMDTITYQTTREKRLIGTVDESIKKGALRKHFSDIRIAHEASFEPKDKKTSGASGGYIAEKKIKVDPTDNSRYMLKEAIKFVDEHGPDRNNNQNTMFFVNEFVTAPLYEIALQHTAPVIALVSGRPLANGKDSDKILLRSKFLPNFQTVSEFTNAAKESSDTIGPNYESLKTVKNQEKVFAAMLAFGEYDIHAGNIGVIKAEEGNKTEYVLAKIDHGWSGTQFFDNPDDMLQNFATSYREYNYGYQDYGSEKGKEVIIPINVIEFKNAIDQITLSFTDQEIEMLIQPKIQQLKMLGFDIKKLKFTFWENDTKHTYNEATVKVNEFSSLDELAKHYIDHFKKQMVVLKEVSKRLEIISKIDFAPEGSEEKKVWENGQWLEEIKGEDPISWAKSNNKTIDGLSPDDWIKKNKFKVAITEPLPP